MSVAPDILICDILMPDMDGMTVAARVHRLAPKAAVILMSGRIDVVPNDVLDSFGVVAFLKKPIDLRRLRRLVSMLLKDPGLTRKELGSPFARMFSAGR